MRTLPLTVAKAKLSELVESADRSHEEIQITRNGSAAAILIGIDEWESLQETLYWLSQPSIQREVARARAEIASGDILTETEIRERIASGVSQRDGV